MRKPLSTTLEASALEHATISVSAGRRGLEFDPRDLARLTDATMRSVAR
jgi:Cys-tRNA(Pro)/Cys-tRNA(Cys) deacylase